MYLKKHPGNLNDKYLNYMKWHLLDSAIRKYKPELTLNLLLSSPSNILLMKIKQAL